MVNCYCLRQKTVPMALAVSIFIIQKNKMTNGHLRRVFQLSIRSGGNRNLRFQPMDARFILHRTVRVAWAVLIFGMCVLNRANGNLPKIWVCLSIQRGTTKRLLFIKTAQRFILPLKDTQAWAEKICF